MHYALFALSASQTHLSAGGDSFIQVPMVGIRNTFILCSLPLSPLIPHIRQEVLIAFPVFSRLPPLCFRRPLKCSCPYEPLLHFLVSSFRVSLTLSPGGLFNANKISSAPCLFFLGGSCCSGCLVLFALATPFNMLQR